jgi:hypothetical protein
MLTAVVVVAAIFVVLGLVFFVIAPHLTKAGKKKRGPQGHP